MKRLWPFLIFLLINFGGLAIGGIFTADVAGEWYQGLNKAPWTPPGWVFGASWTLIMVLYSIFMGSVTRLEIQLRKRLYLLFAMSFVLNVLWNPVFFYFRNIVLGMIVISTLLLLMVVILREACRIKELSWLLLLPYVIWLIIASSLNAFILINN